MSSYHAGRETAKPRAKVVKPILKKLAQSEKSSLDLDRPVADQNGLGIYDFGGNGVRDVSFTHNRRGYHNRSTSGTSQFSTATSGSGHRAGSFVHPFQQTPRPYTPPIAATASYQNSLRESEHSNSPALTEDEELRHPARNASSLSNNHHTPQLTGAASSKSGLSQPLRIQTKQATSSSRLARASHTSLSNTLAMSPDFTSPTETMSPSSAIRSSIDRGFRIRSRSDVNSSQAETVQEARRRWNEREKEKDEIAAREEIKALEKRNKKEARQAERGHRRSSASERIRTKRSRSDLTIQEKPGLVGHQYSSTSVQEPPITSETFESPERTHTHRSNTKKKTHSAWTKLMMWLRTRFIRMGSKKTPS